MLDLTFGEQVKIILSRKGMTIKELAEIIEERTGKKMSRQNLTQRLGRDNFQEQDMRTIANILEAPFQLDILGDTDSRERAPQYRQIKEKEVIVEDVAPQAEKRVAVEGSRSSERDITIGELVEIHEELDALIEAERGEFTVVEPPVEELLEEMAAIEAEANERERGSKREEIEDRKSSGWKNYLPKRKKKTETGKPELEESEPEEDTIEIYEEVFEESYEVSEEDVDEYRVGEPEDLGADEKKVGDVNPYTGKEYESNSVRMHPTRIGYVQVYDRDGREWTDMTEWAFLGYQERKKALLGKDYEPPIYLD